MNIYFYIFTEKVHQYDVQCIMTGGLLVVIRKLFGLSKNIMSANRQKHKVLISGIPQRTLSAFQTE